jgi:hypothetical protein
MVNMPERILPARGMGRDLPSFGSRSASVISFGPADRIGPLPRGGFRSPQERAVLPLALLACAMLAAGATTVLLRPRHGAPAIQELAVLPPPRASVPSLPPPPESSVLAPPAPVVAVTPSDPSASPVKSTDRVAPSPPSDVRPPADEGEPADRASAQDEKPKRPPARRARRPEPRHPAGDVRTTRRPAGAGEVDVGQTGATPHAKQSRAAPSSSAHPSSWSLPSVLRPGGF